MCIRSIRLYNCLLSALYVSLSALSGFIVSFPLYLSPCRPIRLCCLLSALSVFLPPCQYQALLSPSCSAALSVSLPPYQALLSPFALSVILPPYQALLSPFRSICLLAALSGFVVSFPLYLSSYCPIRLYFLLPALSVFLPPYQALLSPFRSICLLAALSGFIVSFLFYLSPCRPIRLCCLFSALSVLLPPYQALLSPSCSICILAALSGFDVSFRSICDLAALSGFVVSFPLYLSSCRPISLCSLLSALYVFLLPYQALLSSSRSIWLNCNVLILTPLVFFFFSLHACRSASIRL